MLCFTSVAAETIARFSGGLQKHFQNATHFSLASSNLCPFNSGCQCFPAADPRLTELAVFHRWTFHFPVAQQRVVGNPQPSCHRKKTEQNTSRLFEPLPACLHLFDFLCNAEPVRSCSSRVFPRDPHARPVSSSFYYIFELLAGTFFVSCGFLSRRW